MPKIVYIAHDGSRSETEAETGITVMEAAVRRGIPGIVAECGGAMACGTCQVHIDEAWRDKVGERSATERDMLEYIDRLEPGSRLSCQIVVRDDLDGLTVRTPQAQHSG